jgi:hypothetical protein
VFIGIDQVDYSVLKQKIIVDALVLIIIGRLMAI